jgi:hypothetical protein
MRDFDRSRMSESAAVSGKGGWWGRWCRRLRTESRGLKDAMVLLPREYPRVRGSWGIWGWLSVVVVVVVVVERRGSLQLACICVSYLSITADDDKCP